MSNLVKNSYPLSHHRISQMIGSGYCFFFTTLFNSHKSLIQWTLPSLGGVINIGEAHSLAPCSDNMPIFTKCNNSFLKALRCITGTGYGLSNSLICSFKTFLRSSFCSRVKWLSWLIASSTSTYSYLASKISVAQQVGSCHPYQKFFFLLDFYYFSHCFKLLVWRRWGLCNGNSLPNHSMVPMLYLTSKTYFCQKKSAPRMTPYLQVLKYKCLLLVNTAVFIKMQVAWDCA